MYILFILLIALIVYALTLVVLRHMRHRASLTLMSVTSLVAFGALLVTFNRLSLAIGVDLGPGHLVSYSIPQDYTARGLAGVVVLALAVLASLSPVFGLGVALRK